MTPEQYVKWKPKFNKNPLKAKRGDCHAADELVKTTTIANFNKWAKDNLPKEARDLFRQFITIHFGSVEVDEFLQSIKAYPEWM